MNTITMIPIEQLHHHPQNPRLDLGDLTELAESIRQNGVMQNLTVVPEAEFPGDDHYLVVIGNRRMEAAKLAGLEELPCVISDMDYKTQIATMLQENMQRADLTVFEQAQGVQMMMDLGLTEAQISEMTGFSRTTVKRRAEMAKLDKETLKAHCAQLTMDDMDLLMKIRDIEKRNELLKEAGGGSFKWKTENAIRDQKREENYRQIRDILLQAGCIEKTTRGVDDFWKNYEYLPFVQRIDLDEYKAGENILPEDERQLFFYQEYSRVTFWAEKRKPAEEDDEPDEEETAEQKAREEEIQAAWQRLKEIQKHSEESREKFLETLTVKQKDQRKAMEWLMIALVASNSPEQAITSMLPDYDDEQMKALPKDHTETDLDLKWMRGQIDTNPQVWGEMMDALLFDGEDCLRSSWRTSEKPQYCRNISMLTGYEWLADFGYPVSDDERAYLDGTLDCYGEAEE